MEKNQDKNSKTIFLFGYTSIFLFMISIVIFLFSTLSELTTQSIVACLVNLALSVYLLSFKVVVNEQNVVIKSMVDKDKSLLKPIKINKINALTLELKPQKSSNGSVLIRVERGSYQKLLQNQNIEGV